MQDSHGMNTFHTTWKQVTAKSSQEDRLDQLEQLVQALSRDCEANALLPSQDSATSPDASFYAELRSTPAIVKAHYTRALLDSVVPSLSQPPGVCSHTAAVSHRGADAGRWQLLAALLQTPGCKGWSPPVGTILTAAAAACSVKTADDDDSRLPTALLAAVVALERQFPAAFGRTLDQSIVFTAAALSAARLSGKWAALARHLLGSLKRQFQDSSNQRKVFPAACDSLLLPVCRLACPGAGCGNAERGSLSAAALSTLEAAIFHPAHIQGLAELVCTEAAHWSAASFAAQPKGAVNGKEGAWLRTYQWQLFKALGSAICGEDAADAQAALHAGPWLLERFLAAAQRHQRVAAADSAAVGTRDGKNSTGGIPRAADFAFFSALVQPSLQLLRSRSGFAFVSVAELPGSKRKRKSQGTEVIAGGAKRRKTEKGVKREPEALVSAAAAAAAELLHAVKHQGCYRPTEDAAGHHEALLAAIADATISAANRSDLDSLLAARLVGAIINLEHRALEAHMEQLWPLIWQAAEAEPSGGNAVETAAEVAKLLVGAFSELRQLGSMLSSLAASISKGCSSEAADVVCSPTFLNALQKALQDLPPGQAASVVDFVGSAVDSVEGTEGHPGADQALAALCTACLSGLKVTLPTSAALATAVEQLLNGSLGGKLSAALRSASRSGSRRQPRTERWPRLTALLRIYACALRMHAECSGMQPQIAPLAGQGIGDAIASAGGEKGGDKAAAEGGYFACLGSNSQLPDLGDLGEAVMETSFSDEPGVMEAAKLALAGCIVQRMRVLRERIVHANFTCPLIRVDQGSADAQGKTQGNADAAAMEAEMRQLAELLVQKLLQPPTAAAAADGETHLGGSRLLAVASRNAGLVLPWCCLESAAGLLESLFAAATTEPGSSGSLRALQSLTEESSILVSRAWVTALARRVRSLLMQLFPVSQLQPLAHLAAMPEPVSSSGAASREGLVLIQSDHLRNFLGQSLGTLDATASEALHSAPAEQRLRQLSCLLRVAKLLGSRHLTAKDRCRLMDSILTVPGSFATAAAKPSQLGSKDSECRTLETPDLQQPPAAAVAAVEAAAALLAAETAGSRTDDAVSRLAAVGPLSLRLLLRLEQWCRPGNENLADSMLQHVSSTASRLMAFLLGMRSPSLASLSSQPHPTLYSGQAEALAGLLAELDAADPGATAGTSYGQRVLLNGLASGVAAAWSCVKEKKPKKQPGSSVVAGPTMHRQHCIEADVLVSVTASVSAASAAGMKELQRMCQEVPDALPQPVTTQMEACASAAGHIVDAQRWFAAPAPPLPIDPGELAGLLHQLLVRAAVEASQGDNQGSRPNHPALYRTHVTSALACLVRHLQHQQSSSGGAADDALFDSLAESYLLALQRWTTLGPEECTAASRAALLAGIRSLAEAASLPQTRALLDRARKGILGADTASQALPFLENAYESLEASGSPAKQRLIGGSADACASAALDFLHRQQPAAEEEEAAEAIRVALKCLESMAARPSMFSLAPRHTAAALGCTLNLDRFCSRQLVFLGVCKLLVALLRHRAAETRRCMALLTACCRLLLQHLLQSRGQCAAACAEGLAHVYEAISEQQDALGSYCAHLLADYIVLAAAPADAKGPSAYGLQAGDSAGSSLTAEAWIRLRKGAYALYGACGPTQVQHVFAVLGKTAGGARGAAMASLKSDYEKHHKYTGKV